MYARFLLSCSSMLSRTRSGFELLRIMILTAVQTEMFSYFCTTLSIADNRIFLCPSVVLICQLIEWHSDCFYLYCGIFYYASKTMIGSHENAACARKLHISRKGDNALLSRHSLAHKLKQFRIYCMTSKDLCGKALLTAKIVI